LFNAADLAEIRHPDFPGERLVACLNPLLQAERARKREDLLPATERELDKIVAATRREKRALRSQDRIGLRVGKVLNRFKVGKHFEITITETAFSCTHTGLNRRRSASGRHLCAAHLHAG
jgi:hypothetical protein